MSHTEVTEVTKVFRDLRNRVESFWIPRSKRKYESCPDQSISNSSLSKVFKNLRDLCVSQSPNQEGKRVTTTIKMLFEGYGRQLWNGTLETVQLALLSVLLAFVIGLVGAAAKLSQNRWLSFPAVIYTTLIRGVPDLVLMLLLFYSFQDWLNRLTDALNQQQIDIDPFVAGVCVLGFIYGAYFTETFREGCWQFRRDNWRRLLPSDLQTGRCSIAFSFHR